MANVALEVNGLEKHYPNGTKALQDVSFAIPQGLFFGLLGPNGAGKTTLIGILGGLIRPTAGTASIMGCDVVKNPLDARRQIGIVPQEIVFDPFFTTREYLRQQSRYYGLFDNDAWINELLDHMGLTDQANTNTRYLSGGMKRRLMAAMAMVHKPPVIVLDEPTAGVDVSQRRNLWAFIKKINQEGSTVILTTHYLDEAEELCERIVLLNHGKILADHSTNELLTTNLQHSKCIFVRLGKDQSLPPDLPFDHSKQPDEDGRYHVFISEYFQVEEFLAHLRNRDLAVEELEISNPDLEEVFVSLTEEK